MKIVVGLILVIACVGMMVLARPKQGQDSAIWLSKPWILGQAYIMLALVVAVVGVSLVVSGWPS
jgi:hypothetical protein